MPEPALRMPRGKLTVAEIEREIEKCAEDPLYFIGKYVWIEGKEPEAGKIGGRPIRFGLWDCQDGLFRRFFGFRKHVILKRRQIGLSTLVGIFLLWKCLFHQHIDALVVSEKEDKAIEFLTRIKFSFDHLPSFLKPTVLKRGTKKLHFGIEQKVDGETVIGGKNSRITVAATTETAGRSYTCTDFVGDEAAFISNLKVLLAATEPGIDSVGGNVFLISTGDMTGDEFYQIYFQSKKGASEYTSYFIPFADENDVPARPDQTVAWRDEKIAMSFDPILTRREYPMTEAEAFMNPGSSVFNEEKLLAMLDVAIKHRPGFVGDLYGDRDEGFTLADNPRGYLKIWEHPRADRGYVIACDVAQGVKGGDYSSAHVRDRDTREVVAHWHGRCDESEFALQMYRLGAYYRWAFIGIEANNTGIWVARELDRQKEQGGLGYPPECLLRRQQVDKPGSDRTQDSLGWWTGETSRSALVGDLAKAIVNDQLPLWCEDTIRELLSFRRNDRGKPEAARGAHDDRVISLGLSEQCLHRCYLPINRGPQADEMTDCAKHIESILGKGHVSRRAAGYPETESAGKVFCL